MKKNKEITKKEDLREMDRKILKKFSNQTKEMNEEEELRKKNIIGEGTSFKRLIESENYKKMMGEDNSFKGSIIGKNYGEILGKDVSFGTSSIEENYDKILARGCSFEKKSNIRKNYGTITGRGCSFEDLIIGENNGKITATGCSFERSIFGKNNKTITAVGCTFENTAIEYNNNEIFGFQASFGGDALIKANRGRIVGYAHSFRYATIGMAGGTIEAYGNSFEKTVFLKEKKNKALLGTSSKDVSNKKNENKLIARENSLSNAVFEEDAKIDAELYDNSFKGGIICKNGVKKLKIEIKRNTKIRIISKEKDFKELIEMRNKGGMYEETIFIHKNNKNLSFIMSNTATSKMKKYLQDNNFKYLGRKK